MEGVICITERWRTVSKAVSSGVLCSGKLRLRTTAEQTGWGDGKEENSHSTQTSSEQPEILLELGDSTEGSP